MYFISFRNWTKKNIPSLTGRKDEKNYLHRSSSYWMNECNNPIRIVVIHNIWNQENEEKKTYIDDDDDDE